jgi:hypothetical protein
MKERAKKTRKLTRELREFTGVPSEGKRKCKGWSNEGMLAFKKQVRTTWKDMEDGKHAACLGEGPSGGHGGTETGPFEEKQQGAIAKGKVQANCEPGRCLPGLLEIQRFSLDCTVQSWLVANLSVMIKTLNLENQPSKM